MSIRSILTFLLVFCGVAAVVVAVSMSRFRWSASGATAMPQRVGLNGSAVLPQYPKSAAACTGAGNTTASRGAMQDIADHAQMLVQQRRLDEALTRYDDLQQLDPGFPGLHLDRATALIAAGRYNEALRAVDAQISVSQCLENLPSAAIDAYCKRALPAHTTLQCRSELKTFERTAHFQAAIAQMQMGREAVGESGSSNALRGEPVVAASTPAGIEPEPQQVANEVPPHRISEPPVHRASAAPRPRVRSDGFASAAGTDAALGAYSH